MKITIKKTTTYRERSEEKRASYGKAIATHKNEDLVYVDGSGIHRRQARSGKGKRVVGFVAERKFRRTNIVAAYGNGKTIAECIYDCTTDSEVFNAWVEQFLVPALRPGQVVVMDNASFHKQQRTRELIEESGCTLLFLPPYSPDLNLIEKFWANFKRKLASILHLFHSFDDAFYLPLPASVKGNNHTVPCCGGGN
jgi:transposase